MLDHDTSYLRWSRLFLSLFFWALCCFTVSVQAQPTPDETITTQASAFDETPEESSDQGSAEISFRPIRTESPRQTFRTFLQLKDDLELTLQDYSNNKTRALREQATLIGSQFIALIDLSLVPSASRREVGVETATYLLDILGRIQLPDIDEVPDEEALSGEAAVAQWRIPGTPIRIVAISEGPREGEFLFSGRTIRAAPRFYRGIENLPLRTVLGIKSWTGAKPQLTGPMIPAGVLQVMPDGLKRLWLDTPRWKVLAVFLVSLLAVLLLMLTHWAINRGESRDRFSLFWRRTLTPIAILVVLRLLHPIIVFEIDVSGRFSAIVEFTMTAVTYAATTWLFWLAVLAIFERIIKSRRLPEESFDTQLWRIGGRTIGVLGSIVILGAGVQELGLPLYSVVAGLGIGGLAVALAVRPTLENLIGGILLYLDQPVRVGDFCTFGDKTGTVEKIGVRSTKVRAIDRTLITVPNAALADMQLINWARCDRMLINTTIGLRYETDSDQLRYVMANFRKMLHAHPKIHRDTVRVRFATYGASSLDIGVRVFALTQEWNEFHAIREDIFLRMKDIVEESGTGFAFPSQTLYLGRDDGLDSNRTEAAVKKVQSWRKRGELPFPRMSMEQIDQLEATLDYPPRGSVEIGLPEEEVSETGEPLSAEPGAEEENSSKQSSDARPTAT